MLDIYKASAGSGKTYILVKEYIKKSLSSNTRISHKSLLAITFTNKAASEMKTRIISTLFVFSNEKNNIQNTSFKQLYNDLKIELNYSDIQLVKRSKQVLLDIIHYYSLFSVSTIDKFIHKIIRAFSYELELPSNFSVEMDQNKIIKDGVIALIDEVGFDSILTQNLLDYSYYKTEQNKNWDIQEDLLELSKQLFKDQKFLVIHDLTDIKKIKKNKTHIISKINFFETHVASLRDKISNIIQPIPRHVFPYLALPNYLEKLKKKPYKDILISEKKNSRLFNALKTNNWCKSSEKLNYQIQVESISEKLNLTITDLINFLNNHYSYYQFFKECYNSFLLLSVLARIDNKIDEIKKENNIIHISEFNQIVLKFLRKNPVPFIYEKIGTKYGDYFIDEFQDTSLVQWQNITPLIEEALSKGGSCLIVGDGKQAIYRWRGGEVNQFLELINNDKNNPLTPFNSNIISLNFNYRSGKNIVQFNNSFFSFLAHQLKGDYHRLYSKLNQQPAKNEDGYIEIVILDFKSIEAVQETLNKIEAQIKETIHDGYKFSDIAILTRSNKEIIKIATYLNERGIPIISSESLLLKYSSAVQFIVNNLNIIINQQDYLSRARLIEYLINYKIVDITNTSSHSIIEKIAKCEFSDFELYLQQLDLNYKYSHLKTLNIYELVENIIRVFDLHKTYNVYLTFFLDLVFECAVNSTHSVIGFLEYWEQKKDTASIIIPSGVDAVELMTIHKSKGLQFPVVIFPFANWKTDQGRDKKWMYLQESLFNNDSNDKFLTLLPLKKELESWPEPFPSEYMEHTQKVLLDNINLLYVAMTRPTDRIYVISNCDSKKGNIFNYFTQFLSQYDLGLFKGNLFKYGTKINKSIEPSDLGGGNCPLWISEDWRDRIKIRRKHFVDQNLKQNYSIVWGYLIHEIMAGVKTKSDIDIMLESLNVKNTHGIEIYQKIKTQIEFIIQDDQIKDLFMNNKEIFLETSILCSDGKIYRPDRVVVHDTNYASLIDYKTGKEDKEHIKQIKKYEDVLFQLGYKKIQGYIVYLSTGEIKKVS